MSTSEYITEARSDHSLIVAILIISLLNALMLAAVLWRVFDLSLD